MNRKLFAWLIASLLGGVFLMGFGYERHYFEGEWRWFALSAAVVCWLIISVATWVIAKETEKAEDLLKKNPWKW